MMLIAVLLPHAGPRRRCRLPRIDLRSTQGPALPAAPADSPQLRDNVSAQAVISQLDHLRSGDVPHQTASTGPASKVIGRRAGPPPPRGWTHGRCWSSRGRMRVVRDGG